MRYDGSRYYCEIAGGTAEKATVDTADLLSGSKYLDVQTGNWYVYDELSNSWALSQEGGSADPAVIEQAVTDWLDAHPEATTTVADGSITEAKLASALAQKVNQVTSLSDEIDAVITSEEVWDDPVSSESITRIPDKNFITSNGGIQDKTGWSLLYWQATESGKYKIVFSKSQANNKVNIYSSETFSASTYVKKASAVSTTQKIVEVESGQYIVAQSWYTDYTIEITKSDGMVYDVPSIDTKIMAEENNLFGDGWRTFPVDKFALNDWNSYNGTTSRTYRVRYTEPIQYAFPITIMAAPGFYLDAYYSNGNTKSAQTTIDLPENTPVKISIRRINENFSEIADITEFASALAVSTPLAGIEKNKLTFTDISMFDSIGACGDSYTAGGGYISGVTALTWGKNLERQAGITVNIFAKSGESIHSASGWNYDNDHGLPKLLNSDECGLYWMAHGINSSGSDTAIGTPADMEANPKPYTFYGQYVYAINAIKAKFPRARIVIQTITGTSYSLWETTYAKINTAIRNIAEFCNIPFIELINDDFYKSTWYANHSTSNHPTAMLAAGMAMANRRLLSQAILDNPDYFIDYGNKYKTAISCPLVTGGSISASPSVAANGATVTLSNTPLTGYHFVRYESADVTISDNTFVVPGSSNGVGHGTYTITGVFEADT